MGVDSPIDVSSEQYETILTLLRKYLPETTAWVYGSRAKRTSRPHSDLDLVIFAEPGQHLQVGELKEAFDESNLPFRVDLFVWDEVPESFREQIERRHVILTKGADESHQRYPRVALADLIDLRLSSVDKKSKSSELPVRLCNYTDVYYNSVIHQNMSFMGATASDREIAKCTLSSGDVVITKDSEQYDDIGVPAFVMDDVPNLVCGYHLAILRPDTARVHGRYLFYALSTHDAQTQFHYYANGVTRFGLRKADIGLVEIPLPSLEEQRTIARILGALDDKIELNQKTNKTLEEIARAIFKSWFVDFDPVRAKAEGRPTGLTPEISDLFPDALVESEIGEVPRGWEVEEVGTLATLFKKSISPTKYDETFVHYSIPAFDAGQCPLLDMGSTIKSNKTLVPDDALLVSKLNPEIPRVWLPSPDSSLKKICSTEFMVFQPTPKSNRSFLWAMFSEKKIQARMESMVTGTSKSHQRVKPKDVSKILIPCPSDRSIEVFGEVAEPLLSRILVSREESLSLNELRDTLLPKLITGELRIPDAEKFLEEADL